MTDEKPTFAAVYCPHTESFDLCEECASEYIGTAPGEWKEENPDAEELFDT